MNVVVWLRSLGLERYEAIFRENDVDETVLPSLTHENLKELGVASFGHRVKMLDAIAALRSDANHTAFKSNAERLITLSTSAVGSAVPTPRSAPEYGGRVVLGGRQRRDWTRGRY